MFDEQGSTPAYDDTGEDATNDQTFGFDDADEDNNNDETFGDSNIGIKKKQRSQ